jgi:hypothetical protein
VLTRTTVLSGDGLVDLREVLEETMPLILRDSRTRVLHGYFDEAGKCRRRLLHADRY